MSWLSILLVIPILPVVVFLAWFLKKIYLRITKEFLQTTFITSSGKSITTGPLDSNQENINAIFDFLSKPETNFITTNKGNYTVVLPRKFVENCVIKTKTIRRFSLSVKTDT